MQNTELSELRKSWILRFISIGFILAPIGNILMSFIFLRIPNWWYPQKFIALLLTTSLIDLAWNLLILFAGMLLLYRRKAAWAVAIAAVSVASGMNIYLSFASADGRSINPMHTGLALGCSALIVILIFYFRYPYLDNRDRWTHLSIRNKVRLPLTITEFAGLRFMLVDISSTGAMIEFIETSPRLQKTQKLHLQIGENSSLEAHVVRTTDKGFAVEFAHLSAEQKKLIQSLGFAN